jgi:hypothetical protein
MRYGCTYRAERGKRGRKSRLEGAAQGYKWRG